MSSKNDTPKNFFDRLPVAYYDVDCAVAIASPDDPEIWEVTITFTRPIEAVIAFKLPCRHAIKGWLPWRKKSALEFIPEEMIGSPKIAAPWLLAKALECGTLLELPELGLLKGCVESRMVRH